MRRVVGRVADGVALGTLLSPEYLAESIRPDVLVKGRDYKLDEVVGASFVQSYGGKVLLAELQPGHSTTATIARMR